MSSKILIADDDGIMRSVMAGVLSDRGHAVTQADDGARALALLRSRHFDVAVLDYHMPQLDGATAIRRGGAALPDTRFIGVTADPEGLEMTGADLRFDAVLQKPLHLPAFLQTVEASLADLRRTAVERDILAAWREGGFERRPRARFAGDVGRDCEARASRAFDLSQPGNPDVLLVSEAARLAELADLRTDGNLFALPMIDVAGRWGALADAVFDIDERAGWSAVAALARGFAARRSQLAARFLSAGTLAEKLLAYVFVSGRDLVPVTLDEDEWTPNYPGFFPVRRVRGEAEKLARVGLLARTATADGDLGFLTPPRFAVTPAAVALLTGNDMAEAPFRRGLR